MDTNTKLKFMLKHLGLPARIATETYDKVEGVRSVIEKFREKIFNAPTTGVLLISGTASPIVLQFMDMGRKVAGVSFVDYYDSQFTEDKEPPPVKDVVLIYGVGIEPAKNPEYSGRLLNSLIDFYKNKEVLVIVETPLTLTNFAIRYGIDFSNKKALPLKKEKAWV